MENFEKPFQRTRSIGSYDFFEIIKNIEYFEKKNFDKKQLYQLVNKIILNIQIFPNLEIFSTNDKIFLQNFSILLKKCCEKIDFDNFDFFVFEDKILLFNSLFLITNFLFPDFSLKTKTQTFLKKIHQNYKIFLQTGKIEQINFSKNYEDFCNERKIVLFYFPQLKKHLFDDILPKDI